MHSTVCLIPSLLGASKDAGKETGKQKGAASIKKLSYIGKRAWGTEIIMVESVLGTFILLFPSRISHKIMLTTQLLQIDFLVDFSWKNRLMLWNEILICVWWWDKLGILEHYCSRLFDYLRFFSFLFQSSCYTSELPIVVCLCWVPWGQDWR